MGERLAGKVALVTGASSGIGRAAATLFAREDVAVVLADRDGWRGQQAAEIIAQEGRRAVIQRADVSREEGTVAVVARAVELFGGLDILFNNAGILPGVRCSSRASRTGSA